MFKAVQLFQTLFERDFEQLFDVKIFELVSAFNFSPLRLIPPSVRVLEDGIVVYSGITDFPSPLRKYSRTKFNFLKFVYFKEISYKSSI